MCRSLVDTSASLGVDAYLLVEGHQSEQESLRLRTGPAPSLDAEARTRYPTSSFEAWKQTYVVREVESRYFFFEEDAHAAVLVTGNDNNMNLYEIPGTGIPGTVFLFTR